MTRDSNTENPRVPSVDRALKILELVSENEMPLGVNAIARTLTISPSSCFTILKTLVQNSYLTSDAATKTYTLGPKAMTFAIKALELRRPFEIAEDVMKRIASKRSVAACVLWRLRPDNHLMVVGTVSGGKGVSIQLDAGHTLPLLIGATGRCAAADLNLAPEQIKDYLSGAQWDNPPPMDAYIEDVERARVDGWAFDQGNFLQGVTTIAVPIPAGDSKLQYCLSVALFGENFSQEFISDLATDLKKAAKKIGTRLFSS
ncbi:IclR family transcriptional regulator [Kineobactrum salinum]|uniref:HTH-type transcriptional repressor AllR n=1 Tax=Kineobactrum salinum TaxID=2708301 RepID=A0A6C0U2B0_9GAMM|nr:IclR family transcriptional regulator [Kineobactrum salinum]QIB65953.1 IclR family transcriptional regulator [Kineobactrum salinum]